MNKIERLIQGERPYEFLRRQIGSKRHLLHGRRSRRALCCVSAKTQQSLSDESNVMTAALKIPQHSSQNGKLASRNTITERSYFILSCVEVYNIYNTLY